MKTGVSCRKSLAVYFLAVYRRTLSSLHLLSRVCKAASAALWTLTQGSCRSAWSPAAESIAEFSERRMPRLELCHSARLHVEGQLYVEVGAPCLHSIPTGRIWIFKLRIYLNAEAGEEKILTL